ncbi:hypothetical protein H5522_004795 [Salmonella enterica]|nr:hypothetical protein [Salmonella enterica]
MNKTKGCLIANFATVPMKSLRLAAEDFPLALATAKILPWPWGESSYRSALADIGSAKGNPWVQDI